MKTLTITLRGQFKISAGGESGEDVVGSLWESTISFTRLNNLKAI